jgi:Protein of unknown function (DUF3987)
VSEGIDFTAPDPPDEPVSVVPFPVLHDDALHGVPGAVVGAVAPHTEAHPAAVLVQYLARFGATVGDGPHVLADNRKHPARLFPLIVGKTSDGAKGTSYGVVRALFDAAERTPAGVRRGHLQSLATRGPLRCLSGLSSGEGLIETIRDANGDDPNAKGFDEGVSDKRLLIVEQEFTSMLAVMERQGSTLPRIVREAWDGDVLRTLTRNPLAATDPHVIIVGHVTAGELRIRLKESALVGGTMNRFLPVASRRTKLLPAGGNIPVEILHEYGPCIGEALAAGAATGELKRTDAAEELWFDAYPMLSRARPDGPVASILARARPQVLRLSAAYALADLSDVIDEPHLRAALALWRYIERTAEWMFGDHVDPAALDGLIGFVTAGGTAGRTRTEISVEHYKRNKPAAEISASLGELVKDGRVREEVDRSGPGRPTVRYFAC